MRQKHGGTQHHNWGVLVSAFNSASAAATSAAFSPLHVVFVVDMAGDSPIIVPALRGERRVTSRWAREMWAPGGEVVAHVPRFTVFFLSRVEVAQALGWVGPLGLTVPTSSETLFFLERKA